MRWFFNTFMGKIKLYVLFQDNCRGGKPFFNRIVCSLAGV